MKEKNIDVAHFLKSICKDTAENKKAIEQLLTDLAAEADGP